MKRDLYSGVVWLVIFTVIFAMARSLPASVSPYPTLVAVSGLTLSVIQLILFTTRVLDHKRQVAAGVCQPETEKKIPLQEKKRIAAVGLMVFAYCVCFRILGYLISTPVFLFAFMHLFRPNESGREAIKTEAIISVVFTGAIYVLFDVLLKVSFPTGIFF